MKKSLAILSTLTATLFFSGCATILDGKQQTLNLTSNVPHQITLNNEVYQAPAIILIDRPKKDGIIKIEDCQKQFLLKKQINNTFFVNLLSGGPFGSTTDSISGAMWEYDNTNVDVSCPND